MGSGSRSGRHGRCARRTGAEARRGNRVSGTELRRASQGKKKTMLAGKAGLQESGHGASGRGQHCRVGASFPSRKKNNNGGEGEIWTKSLRNGKHDQILQKTGSEDLAAIARNNAVPREKSTTQPNDPETAATVRSSSPRPTGTWSCEASKTRTWAFGKGGLPAD